MQQSHVQGRKGSWKQMLAALAFVFGVTILAPAPAMAQMAGMTIQDCSEAGGFPPEALTGPIVFCVESTIRNATVSALAQISDYFRGTVATVLIVAVTMHGARIAAGERGFNSKSVTEALKVAFVAVFSFNLGGFAQNVFDIMDELLTWAVMAPNMSGFASYTPWGMIDTILGTLFGFSPGIALFQGLMWLGTGITSDTTSFAMSSGVIVAFLEFLLFLMEIVYTFLTAYLIVAFMLIISPMFVPMFLFQQTERYFRKWLDTIIGAMLVPVFIFAFLSISLGVYIGLIAQIFTILLPTFNFTMPMDPANPPDFSHFWKINQPLFGFSMGMDPNYTNDLSKTLDKTKGQVRNVPIAQGNINPFNRGGFDPNGMNPPGINFGPHHKEVGQKVLFALISLWIYTSVLKQLIEKLPGVAQEIAGSAGTLSFKSPSLKEKVNEVKSESAQGLTTVAGGALGGNVASGSGSKQMTEAGAIGGALMGNMLGRKALK